MNFIIRNLKRIIRFWFSITKVNWIKFIKNYSSREGIVVVIPGIIKNYFINSLELDILNIAALLKNNQCIFFGKDFTKFSGKNMLSPHSLNPLEKSNANHCRSSPQPRKKEIMFSFHLMKYSFGKQGIHNRKFEELEYSNSKDCDL